jgi:hypothetical protein
MSSALFPPLLDLCEAGWPVARMTTAASVTSVNNRAVEQAARDRLDLTDHVYGFGHFCDVLAAGSRDE